jgi:hypothetical protein
MSSRSCSPPCNECRPHTTVWATTVRESRAGDAPETHGLRVKVEPAWKTEAMELLVLKALLGQTLEETTEASRPYFLHQFRVYLFGIRVHTVNAGMLRGGGGRGRSRQRLSEANASAKDGILRADFASQPALSLTHRSQQSSSK